MQPWLLVLPTAAMAVLAWVTAILLVVADPSATGTRVVLAIAGTGTVVLLGATVYGARDTARRVRQRVDALRALSAHGRADLRALMTRLENGERPTPRRVAPPPAEAADRDPFTLLALDLHRERHAAREAVMRAASLRSGTGADRQVEVFVNVARRMQSLVHREIGLLDELEARVEDPELLKGLFTIDHLATRMRRQSESLAVLGGASSRRQWTRPVDMYEVLRSSVAEVEQYPRVKVVPPVLGALRGDAVADVIHLVAELIENATRFSPPHTHVLLRTERVAAGLAVEVEDRGLGMAAAEQRRMNELLADPDRVSVDELLRDGRIGLFVVASLARRHGVRVRLRSNVFGGTQAVAVLPNELVTLVPRETAAAAPAPAAGAQGTQGGSPAPTPAAHARPVEPRYASAAREVPAAPVAHAGGPGAEAASGGAGAAPPDAPPPPSPADSAPGSPPADRGERPPLPERRAQTHLAPQLREPPAPRREEEGPLHSPGLMAAFRGGVRRAEREDGGHDPGGSAGPPGTSG
ncbi:ATP-binding protein [Actinomadura sp. NBRC 104425]|uniref:sensor histidine kinase n=1 Tax=Actinomadura sp. NBRC 104425 TaxID=3032204 RepID=UPI00255440C7|nr:ATP-binding protein [Actinomadura sp. NBRC 104425]